MNKNAAQIPRHLPDKLAICFYVWHWIFEDAYADLDKAMRETKDRGFNCVRVDTGALLTHDQQGKPRGPIRIRPWIEDWNNVPYPLKAHEMDVLERVLELFRVADKHDMTVICTSWLYQDLVTQLADPALHAEIIAIPYKDRIMELARQHDRLVTLLKERGLAHRIAFVEVLNEAEFSPLFVPKSAPTKPPTFEEFARWTWPELADKAASAQEFNRAVRYLRERHPDILFTMDYAWSGSLDDLWAPESQLVDFHYYHGLLNKLFKLLDFPMDREPDLDARPELRRFLVPNPSSWLEFRAKVQHLRHVGSFWHTASWLYHNLDMAAFDAWYVQDAKENEAYYITTAETWMGKARDFARERGLPLVLDETGAFWPPINTGIYSDPVGQRHEEILVDIAVRDGYWGIMPTGSMSPYMPYWNDPEVVRWLQRERAAYAGYCLVYAPFLMQHFAEGIAFLEKTIRDAVDAQREDGLSATASPVGPGRDAGKWAHQAGGGSVFAQAPWQAYLYTGDTRAMAMARAAAEKYLARVVSYFDCQAGLVGIGQWDYLADWYAVIDGEGFNPLGKVIQANSMYIVSLDRLSKGLAALGEREAAARYGALAAEQRQRFHAHYYKQTEANYGLDHMTYLAEPLLAEVPPKDEAEAVFRALEHNIRVVANGHPATGDGGTHNLLQCLAMRHRPDLVYLMVNQTEPPSWGAMVKNGDAGIWEHWFKVRSRCHVGVGSIGEWFLNGLAGIQCDPARPGFRHAIVRPYFPPDMEWLSASSDSVQGRIAVSWRKRDGTVTLEVSIPPNTTATLVLPVGVLESITESGRPVAQAPGIAASGTRDGLTFLELGSGHFVFAWRL